MKIAIAGDHYTVELMRKVETLLTKRDIEFVNLGTTASEQKISLQEIIPAVVESIRNGQVEAGILACGTGAGVEIGANRFKGIRAALCTMPKQAEYAKVYDDANLVCLSAWLTDDPASILEAWLDSTFDENPKRTQQLKDFDAWS